MRSIDNCYQKCVSHFCCWRWYTITTTTTKTTKTTTTTTLIKREHPRWSLLAVVIAVEPLLKFDWNSIESHCFQFWFLLFLHTQRQNDFLLLRLHQCLVCYENVRLCIVCCFFSLHFLCISFEPNACASFIFFDYSFWCNVRLFLCCLNCGFVVMLLHLWFCASFFLLCPVRSHRCKLHHCTCCSFGWSFQCWKEKRSKTIYFCRPIYFPSTLPWCCWMLHRLLFFLPPSSTTVHSRSFEFVQRRLKTPAVMECFWFCIQFARWF